MNLNGEFNVTMTEIKDEVSFTIKNKPLKDDIQILLYQKFKDNSIENPEKYNLIKRFCSDNENFKSNYVELKIIIPSPQGHECPYRAIVQLVKNGTKTKMTVKKNENGVYYQERPPNPKQKDIYGILEPFLGNSKSDAIIEQINHCGKVLAKTTNKPQISLQSLLEK